MRIGIDGRAFQGNLTGIGKYIFELCRGLDRYLPDARFYIYSQLPIRMPVCTERWEHRQDRSIFAKYMKPVMWLKLRCGQLCRQDNLDVFWSIATFSPSLSKEVKVIITVHDLIFKIIPESMPFFHLWSHRLFLKKEIDRASIIITNSKGTSDRLNKFYGRNTDMIINPSIDSSFYPRSKQEIQECMKKYNITNPYLLSVATWTPIKNLELLIHAYINMKKGGLLPKHNLVLVGGRGWDDKRLLSIISQNESYGIIPLGYIPDNDLPMLYSGADIFVFPSLYEGFGIPVLEARACGTKVVTSDMPELHEAGGDDATYIVPSEEGIRKGILDSLSKKSEIKSNNRIYPSSETGASKLAQVFKGLVS